MGNQLRSTHLVFCLVATVPFLDSCSGAKGGVNVEPDYRNVEVLSVPSLLTDPQNPQIRLITVNQEVRFEAWSLGQNVNDKVKWIVQPRVWATNLPGSMTPGGYYLAPSQPSQVSIGIDRAASHSGNIVYQGGILADILAAPRIDSFTASLSVVAPGQSTQLTATFGQGQGQILAAGQVVFPNLVSGSAVAVTPTISTTYTLRVTNAAGTKVERDLSVQVQ